MSKDSHCANCGKYGHLYHQCKLPIMSNGVIAFRVYHGTIQYLMIRRKDTLGYVDFMRGKFSFHKQDLLNMFRQMTTREKNYLKSIRTAKEKINQLIDGVVCKDGSYNLLSLIAESDLYETYVDPEWGFPKGRRNLQENDYDCAMREFSEETGYDSSFLRNFRNIVPFEETFIGSNYNSYRHKYYLSHMDYGKTLDCKPFQKSEVSCMAWFTLDECLAHIRGYNLEKKKVIQNVDKCVRSMIMYTVDEK